MVLQFSQKLFSHFFLKIVKVFPIQVFDSKRELVMWWLPTKFLMLRDFDGSRSQNHEKAFKAGNQTFELCQNSISYWFLFERMPHMFLHTVKKLHFWHIHTDRFFIYCRARVTGLIRLRPHLPGNGQFARKSDENN